MVRRRSTVRFRKGAPQVRRVFRLPIRGPLPAQGEGPAFNSYAKSQVRASVLLPDRCGTVPVGRKDLGHGLSDRLFCPCLWTAAIRRPVPLGGKPGGKIVKRRARRVVVASGRLACGHTSPGRFLPLPAVAGTAQHCTGLATAIRPTSSRTPVPPGTACINRDRR